MNKKIFYGFAFQENKNTWKLCRKPFTMSFMDDKISGQFISSGWFSSVLRTGDIVNFKILGFSMDNWPLKSVSRLLLDENRIFEDTFSISYDFATNNISDTILLSGDKSVLYICTRMLDMDSLYIDCPSFTLKNDTV